MNENETTALVRAFGTEATSMDARKAKYRQLAHGFLRPFDCDLIRSPARIAAAGRRQSPCPGSVHPSIELRFMIGRTTRRSFAAGLATIPLLSRAQKAASLDLRRLTAGLEKQLPALLAQSPTVPAVSMALIVDSKLAWRGAFGVKDFASKTPIDHDTLFESGSVSKTVFAYSVLKLCEKRVLDLDTPLTKYTPYRPLEGDPRLDLITTRHILSHTAGFQNWRTKEDPLAIHFQPGERWSYSGEGYSYLQSVVSHLAGQVNQNDCTTMWDGVRVCATNFDAYMKANLLVPFGMKQSGYLYREGMARPHDSKGVMNSDQKSTALTIARYGSAGGLQTTPTEYARFLIELMNPKPPDAYRLSAVMLKEMVRPQVKITDALSWGLGWAVEHTSAGELIAHSGDNPGYKAMAAASLNRKAGFIMLTNGDRGFDDIIAKVCTSEPMQRFLPVALV